MLQSQVLLLTLGNNSTNTLYTYYLLARVRGMQVENFEAKINQIIYVSLKLRSTVILFYFFGM